MQKSNCQNYAFRYMGTGIYMCVCTQKDAYALNSAQDCEPRKGGKAKKNKGLLFGDLRIASWGAQIQVDIQKESLLLGESKGFL